MAMSGGGIGRRSLVAGAGLAVACGVGARAAARKPKVAIKTNHGVIVVELEAERAPLTSANFLHYVDTGRYDDGSFYRASRTPGAPKEGTIVGGPSERTHRYPPIAHESTTMTGLRHTTGTISLGRYAPGSATADFFICASPEPYLDAHPDAPAPKGGGDNLGYAAFGQVVAGMRVVRTILALPTPGKSRFPDMKGQWLDPVVPIFTMRRVV
jgi:peptidyl-prolyl cis-trans isomerase A (cyclophilin A)